MLALLLFVLGAASVPPSPRPLRVDDIYALREVTDVQVSPDGRSAAFTVATRRMKEDETDTDVYVAPMAGGEAVRLTASAKPERSPRFSPDGKWIAFLSGREGKKTQVWLIPTTGGEATKLTEYKSGVSGLAWSPDSRRLALVVADPDPDAVDEDEEGGKDKAKPKPIVIRRLQFKRDEEGYLRELRDHLHVFDLKSRTGVQVTWGPYDDGEPAWSPDGRSLAFVSNRTADPDRNEDTDVFVVEARPGAEPRRLATGPGHDRTPAWSPDGRHIAYVAGGDPKDMWYGPSHAAVIPAAGGEPRALTKDLDRNVSEPRFTSDGRHVLFLIEDGGRQHLARVPAAGGAATRLVEGDRDVKDYDVGRSGAIGVLVTEPHLPAEVFAVGAAGALTRVSRVNDEVMKGLKLGRVEKRQAKAEGGPAFDYFLTLPPDAAPGTRLPTLLWIHGGPASQDAFAFDLEWQMFAAHGYAVIAPNYRGSTGYGRDFSRALWAAWGTPDFQDVMAAVDDAIAKGVADPERLGVGGWSYGGILTDHVIVKTDRFKAAVSGASEVNYLANYGTDHYQYEWETELGLPWEHPQRWIQLSPFFQVAKVKTPTLVLCGSDDWNVPLLNSEQLYQALRRLGVPTELVVYPGQHHAIRRPSFVKDRLERYLGWFDRYLRPGSAVAAWDAAPQGLSLLGRPLVPAEPSAEARRTMEANLAKAKAEHAANPQSADAIIWLGRRTAYLGRFGEAIEIYTRGLAAHPDDPRLLRHRGHRYVSLRRFDEAVADLSRAAELVRGRPDEIEPDGQPNALNIPTSTLQFNIHYHLALAHYLKGDFEKALAAWQECLKTAQKSDDRKVAVSDWLYMTLRRLGRDAEAAAVLAGIRKDMNVIENHAYHRRLLLYKGELTPEALLAEGGDGVDAVTALYGVANWHLYNGRTEEARRLFEHIVQGPQWSAFAFIAAEADLARMREAS